MGAYLLFPEQVGRRPPFRCYVVLFESVEPSIPTYSLVLVRQISEDAPWSCSRNKSSHFGRTVSVSGSLRPTGSAIRNGTKKPDSWSIGPIRIPRRIWTGTKAVREDIAGVYMAHVPFLGKVVLF